MQIKKIDAPNYQFVTGLFDKYRVFYKQPSDPQLAESFIKARLENKESVIFGAMVEKDHQLVPAGFTQLYPIFSSVKATRNWLLNDLYVDSEYRKQGIGEALIKAAMDFARSENSAFVQLETASDNYTAQKLYETIGFKRDESTCNNDYFVYRIEL